MGLCSSSAQVTTLPHSPSSNDPTVQSVTSKWITKDISKWDQQSASLTNLDTLEEVLSRLDATEKNRSKLLLERSTCFSVASMPSELLVYISPSFTELFGYTNEEVVGANCRFLQKDDREQIAIKLMRMSIDKRQPRVVLLRNYHNRTNALIYNLVYLKPMFDEQNFCFAYLGCQEDVTLKMAQLPTELIEQLSNSSLNLDDEEISTKMKKMSAFFGESIDEIRHALRYEQENLDTTQDLLVDNLLEQ